MHGPGTWFGVALGRLEGYLLLIFQVQRAAVSATLGLRPRGPRVVVATALTLMLDLATSLWFFRSIGQLDPWLAR